MKRTFYLSLTIALLWGVAASAAFAGDTDENAVTFSEQVVRIFQDKCQTCHRPGDIAPMSLLTYEEARPWAKSIRKNVLNRTMPPWHAAAEPGTFVNDNSLTQEEIDTLVQWVNQGAPEGDPAVLPPVKEFDHDGWKAGNPDLVYWMPETYTLPGGVDDEYRCFIIPGNLDQDVWYKGMEIKPGNPEVVHHVIVFADTTDQSLQRDQASPEPGFLCGMASGGLGLRMIGGWAPGNVPTLAKDGLASKLDKGITIVYQVHYHNTTGEDQPDRSGMAVYLARESVRKVPRVMPVGAWELNIKAGDPNSEHEKTWTVQSDISIRAIMPHMHYIGKDMTVTAIYADGREEVILDVPRYDFDWQTTYRYTEPVQMPAGTVIKMVSHHDNSPDNPNQQFDPPRDIHFGEATDDEMAIAWVLYTKDDEELNIQPILPESLHTEQEEEDEEQVASGD